jgi:heme-degrading monooxygenase HmoA
MALVSVTRFRLRSVRFLPFFMLHANRSIAQIRKANGFVAGAVRRDSDQAFWTVTLWRDAHAMRAYGASGAHRKAAPLLAEWADEASVTHWLQAGSALPDWPEAARRLREEGRALALRHPRRSGTEERATEPRTLNAMQL